MQLVANQQLVRNRVRLGLAALLGSVTALVVGAFMSLQVDPTTDVPYVVWIALVVGLVLYTLAQSQLRRWGPRSRQDVALEKAMRGLDERYKLYAFLSSSLPDYIMVSPGGVQVLIARQERGEITCQRDTWKTASSRFGRLLGPGFGNPSADAARQLQQIRRVMADEGLQDVPSTALVVFTNDDVRLKVEGCSATVTRLRSLQDVLRRLSGKGQNVALNQSRVRAVQKVFDDRMSSARAWR